MATKILLEVCVESIQSAITAEQAGADRIELNSALALGGLTPTTSLLEQVKSLVDIPIVCMVRPRPGDFYYSKSEFELMVREAEDLLQHGADGLAIGCLDAQGAIDANRVKQLRTICGEHELVFHRALDCTADLDLAAKVLVDLGVDRLLTSGGEPTALKGQAKIAELQQKFGDKLQVLPGSGIKSSNVMELLKATGCQQIHGTFRAVEKSGSEFRSKINFNQVLGMEADEKMEASDVEIKKMIAAMRN